MSKSELFVDGLFIGYFIYEEIYFADGLVFEDQYCNAYIPSKGKTSILTNYIVIY